MMPSGTFSPSTPPGQKRKLAVAHVFEIPLDVGRVNPEFFEIGGSGFDVLQADAEAQYSINGPGTDRYNLHLGGMHVVSPDKGYYIAGIWVTNEAAFAGAVARIARVVPEAGVAYSSRGLTSQGGAAAVAVPPADVASTVRIGVSLATYAILNDLAGTDFLLQADAGNTDVIRIGGLTDAATSYIELQAGQSIALSVRNLNLLRALRPNAGTQYLNVLRLA